MDAGQQRAVRCACRAILTGCSLHIALLVVLYVDPERPELSALAHAGVVGVNGVVVLVLATACARGLRTRATIITVAVIVTWMALGSTAISMYAASRIANASSGRGTLTILVSLYGAEALAWWPGLFFLTRLLRAVSSPRSGAQPVCDAKGERPPSPRDP